ncbi:thermonuclease family protein [Citricoccus sp.]|uniref:thermonuclease family protein n=1 Tax=Citricoccus sp. TaxID=1978372 RepID=UPI0028BF279B|nr:thermonuclease family protein [Citricoccus sp.]
MTEQRTARRIPVLGIIAFVLLAALLLTLAVLSAVKGVRTAESNGHVVRVEDGQTFVVNMDGTEETVTLAGVMVPRPAAEGEEPTVENCLADEALANLATLLEPGDSVQLEYPEESDGPEGTRLALVHHGGEVVNLQQVEAGLAVPLPEQPREGFAGELREAQETARSGESGLYSSAEPCTLAGRIGPALATLEDLPQDRPTTSAEAETQIEVISAAVEQGVTAEKAFATIDPEETSLASLAWAADVPRLQEKLTGALTAAQADLKAMDSTRNVLQTREREELERQAEEKRQAEAERQREAAERQAEAQREAAERQAEAQREKAQREEAERQAREEQRQAEASASAAASASASAFPSPTPTPSSSAASPSPTDSDDSED